MSLPASIESVDASVYPQLRLRTVLTDSVELTPPRLVQWQVTYEELPDAVLLLNDEVPTSQPVLAEGEDYERTYSAVNVTPNSFTDSITYSQRIFNQTTRTEEINNFKLKALEAEETVNFSVGINTWLITFSQPLSSISWSSKSLTFFSLPLIALSTNHFLSVLLVIACSISLLLSD